MGSKAKACGGEGGGPCPIPAPRRSRPSAGLGSQPLALRRSSLQTPPTSLWRAASFSPSMAHSSWHKPLTWAVVPKGPQIFPCTQDPLQ